MGASHKWGLSPFSFLTSRKFIRTVLAPSCHGSSAFPQGFRCAAVVAAEGGGEVLAGREAASVRDLGHAQWRLLAQQAGGGFQPALIQVLGRGHVRQLFHVMHELGHSQTAAMGHPRQGPLGIEVLQIALQIREEQFHRPLGTGQRLIQRHLLVAEQSNTRRKSSFKDTVSRETCEPSRSTSTEWAIR